MSETRETSVNDLIVQAMNLLGPIAKSQRNAAQGFSFRGIDVVMNAIHPIFAKVGLFVTPDVISHECKEIVTPKGAKMFHHTMNVGFKFRGAGCKDAIYCSTMGEASDSGDKGAAKCMSIALKYALFQTLMIPLEAESDPDGHSPHLEEPEVSPKAKVEYVEANPAARFKVKNGDELSRIKEQAKGTGWVLREEKPQAAVNPQSGAPPLTKEMQDKIQEAKRAAGFTVREIVDHCRKNFDCAPAELTNEQGQELVDVLVKLSGVAEVISQ